MSKIMSVNTKTNEVFVTEASPEMIEAYKSADFLAGLVHEYNGALVCNTQAMIDTCEMNLKTYKGSAELVIALREHLNLLGDPKCVVTAIKEKSE